MNEELIKSCTPLIKSIAETFYGIEKEDLYQVGYIGLLNAYKNYQEDKTTKFSTFAYTYIWGEMYKLATTNSIKQSKDLLKLTKLIDKTKNYLEQKYLKEPSIKDISRYLNIPEEKISYAIQSTLNILSLDKEYEEDTNLYNNIKIDTPNLELQLDIKESIDKLEEPSRSILLLRYYNNYTQQEIADFYGISQVKVSRYEKRSLKKLQKYLITE